MKIISRVEIKSYSIRYRSRFAWLYKVEYRLKMVLVEFGKSPRNRFTGLPRESEKNDAEAADEVSVFRVYRVGRREAEEERG